MGRAQWRLTRERLLEYLHAPQDIQIRGLEYEPTFDMVVIHVDDPREPTVREGQVSPIVNIPRAESAL